MLFADKQALESELKVSLLEIRERELNLYVQCFRSIGTMAGVFAGFALQGACLSSYFFPPDASEGMRMLYLVSTTVAMDLNVAALFAATSCAAMGPGLALRGPDGSMERAVEGLALEYRVTFLTFCLGVLALYASAAVYIVIMMNWATLLILQLILLVALRYTLVACKRIYKKFRLPASLAVGGNFHADGTVGAAVGEAISRHALRLEELSRRKRLSEWPRRQWLYLRLFFDDFVGVSADVYEERYATAAQQPERWYSGSVASILKHLEGPSHVTPGRNVSGRFTRVDDGRGVDQGAGGGGAGGGGGGYGWRHGAASASSTKRYPGRSRSEGGSSMLHSHRSVLEAGAMAPVCEESRPQNHHGGSSRGMVPAEEEESHGAAMWRGGGSSSNGAQT